MWIVPGGGVEPNELPDMAAIREVREEAGVNGALGRCLGVFEVCSFQFFLSPTWEPLNLILIIVGYFECSFDEFLCPLSFHFVFIFDLK